MLRAQDPVAVMRLVVSNKVFLNSVRGSAPKEVVLRAFAEAVGEEIHTSDVYPLCESRGVANASQYVGGLVGDKILVKTRERYYRFVDELFRTYVRIRGWKFRRDERSPEANEIR